MHVFQENSEGAREGCSVQDEEAECACVQASMDRESNKKTGPSDEAIIESFKKCGLSLCIWFYFIFSYKRSRPCLI